MNSELSLQFNKIRNDFPILNQKIYSKRLVYLDHAASALKPEVVIDRISKYYREQSSNIHRSSHFLGSQGTQMYESARETVQKFVQAKSAQEVIFTRGTTESINLVAAAIEDWIQKDDEIILTELEHHSNIVPWQMLAQKKQALIKVVKIDSQAQLNLEQFKSIVNSKTKILSMTMCSNVIGIKTPVEEMIKILRAQAPQALVMLDAAQIVSHENINVQNLDCDFLAFSGHKLFGPNGIGVLYSKQELLEKMNVYQTGGSMISVVEFEKTSFADIPQKFEAGTPSIADALGLESAIKYIQKIGLTHVHEYTNALLKEAHQKLLQIKDLKIYGPQLNEIEKNDKLKAGVISFNIANIHPSDLGSLVDQEGVAIRTGHHCAQPLMKALNVKATARASFSIYNHSDDIDTLVRALIKAQEMLQ